METENERKLRKEFKKIIEDIFDLLNEEFQIEKRNRINITQNRLEKFFIYSSRNSPELIDVWEISKGGATFYLCNVAFETTLNIRGYVSSLNRIQKHNYFYGFLKPSRNFGTSLIRPETIQDKINELFIKTEVDFKEHKAFSSKYYCVAQDKEKFKKAMSLSLMEYLSSLKYIELEFNEDGCLFRLEHSIANKEDAFKFLFIGQKLSTLL